MVLKECPINKKKTNYVIQVKNVKVLLFLGHPQNIYLTKRLAIKIIKSPCILILYSLFSN